MAAVLGVVVIGVVDDLTGVELRVFPLYYVPISVAAWWAGRSSALVAAAASTLAWIVSNQFTGHHSAMWVDIVNSVMQLGSFSLVAMLIAGLRSAHANERARSRTDALTGLLNTRGFFEEAPRLLALAHRHEQALTVAYVDLDDFKLVNDSQGHAVGDQVLRLAADTMRAELRRADLAARIGGDEFVLLLPHTDEIGARSVLSRLHERLQRGLKAECPVTGASMGAAVFTPPPDDLDEVIRQADAVMYSIKASGRGRVIVAHVAEGAPAPGSPTSNATLTVARQRRRETSKRRAEVAHG